MSSKVIFTITSPIPVSNFHSAGFINLFRSINYPLFTLQERQMILTNVTLSEFAFIMVVYEKTFQNILKGFEEMCVKNSVAEKIFHAR